MKNYLTTGLGSCLVVHGPSKTGKTVLVETWFPPDRAIWIKGDEISHVDDLYRRIIDELDLFTEVSTESVAGTAGGVNTGIEVDIVPTILKFKMGADVQATSTYSSSVSRSSLPSSVAKEALRQKRVPIILDDFHFMNEELKLSVARAVKDLIRDTFVVLISIPHSAFDPVKRQRDMEWRVVQLEVTSWESDELLEIAKDGLPLLGIVDHGEVVGRRLALESRGAPFIMQALCLEYVVNVLSVDATVRPSIDAREPSDWSAFFKAIANKRKPHVFSKLLEGKDSRGTERLVRYLKDGRATEIYGAVLYCLSAMGPVTTVTKQDVAQKMSELMVNAPTASTISGNLSHLADIAREYRGDDDPALTYSDPELEILDPFLSFYLGHGSWTLPQAPKEIVVSATSAPPAP